MVVCCLFRAETELPSGFPRITSWPAQLPVVEKGRTHTLECVASGIPEPGISWIRDMVPVNLSNPRYQVLAADSKSKGKQRRARRLLIERRLISRRASCSNIDGISTAGCRLGAARSIGGPAD